MKHGNFTDLAENYRKYRPGYSEDVLCSILGFVNPTNKKIKVADVGSGTGIWAKMISKKNISSIKCVEPNISMLNEGKKFLKKKNIKWILAGAENTKLKNESIDWVTMASSFHWVNFNKTVREFHRLLKPNGYFSVLWNPRIIEDNPILIDIEKYLRKLEEFTYNLNYVNTNIQIVDYLGNTENDVTVTKVGLCVLVFMQQFPLIKINSRLMKNVVNHLCRTAKPLHGNLTYINSQSIMILQH